MSNIKKGDRVIVISGRDKGKSGEVLRVLRDVERVVVQGVNMVKRHTKPTQRSPRGGIIEKEAGLPASNVSLWCAKCSAARRAKAEIDANGKKRRVCVKCSTAFETA